MRCRREVMEISFARWNRLQTATPWFRKGEGTETAARTTCQDKTTVALPIPRSGLVVCRAGPAARRCKSSTQPDGGEGLAMTQGLSPQGRSEGSVKQMCESMDKNRI